MSEAGNKRRERKHRYKERLLQYLRTYKNVLVVEVDNVGSNQMQKVRIALRGKAVLLMGKNTLMRKVIREQSADHPEMENLLQLIYGNIGFVFTNANLNDIRKTVLENKVPAAAKQGSLAPADVYVPAGPTGLDPGQTSFFQALNIATKIVKGTIEIVNVTHLLKVGDKVSSSHVALLTKLNILPFFYGFKVTEVYEGGVVYNSSILDMSTDDILKKFTSAVSKLSAISLAVGYPTAASIGHVVAGSFAKIIALSIETDIEVAQAKPFKDYLANPDAFKSAAASSVPSGGAAAQTSAAAEEAPKEKSEESDTDMGFSLFD